MLDEDNEAKGGQPYQKSTGNAALPVDRPPTLAEKVGNRQYGWRLKELGSLTLAQMHDYADTLHVRGREGTLTGIVQLTSQARTAAHQTARCL